MVDYRKFDHIGSDSEESDSEVDPVIKAEEERQLQQLRNRLHPTASSTSATSATEASELPPEPSLRAKPSTKHKNRFRFEHQGRLVYEWEQTLSEVIMYIPTPPGVQKKVQFDIRITAHHLVVALKGATQRYLDEATGGPIVVDESTWFLEDNDEYNPKDPSSGEKVLVINFQKMHKAQAWTCALRGARDRNATGRSGGAAPAAATATAEGELDALSQEEVRKQMMRERFQEEHPGFDFSGADFNGTVPDAREFMGGVRYG